MLPLESPVLPCFLLKSLVKAHRKTYELINRGYPLIFLIFPSESHEKGFP
jgi:hypothetical protein